ncbi:MAG: tetratricopeptide repeat protein, partial [Candidatus Helarchaeales archaeon]
MKANTKDDPEFENLIEECKTFIQSEQLEKALITIEKIEKTFPENPLVLYYKGIIFEKLGDVTSDSIERIKYHGNALLILEKVRNNGILEHEVLERMAIILEKLGRLQEAIETWHELLELEPGKHEAWMKIGKLHRRIGTERNLMKASKCIRTFLKKEPKNFEALQELGEVHYQLGKIKEFKDPDKRDLDSYRLATLFLSRAKAINPDNPRTLRILGDIEGIFEHREGQIQHYQRVLELEPNDVETWRKLGDAYQEISYLERARLCWDMSERIKTGLKISKSEASAVLNDLSLPRDPSLTKRAAEFAMSLISKSSEAKRYLLVAKEYLRNDPNTAFDYFQKALELCEEVHNRSGQSEALRYMALIYGQQFNDWMNGLDC